MVVVLRGRFAGHKAVVVRVYADGRDDRKFGHAVVAGLERTPRKVTRAMAKDDAKSGAKRGKVTKRSSVKPFVKFLNLQHIMPTRYTLDVSDKIGSTLDDPTLIDKEKLRKAKKTVRETLEDRYRSMKDASSDRAAQGVSYFFRKLHF